MLEKGKIITFLQKNFQVIKELERGALGRTVLLKDNEIGENFVCKKYEPYDENNRETYYEEFKNEIKLMHNTYHKNIVRIFNYYLYPEDKTGYIVMEYVENGEDIKTFLSSKPENINEIFEQVIEAFDYLESIKILHRDIRSQNILVDENGGVKVIDFGFGKKCIDESDEQKSISLNWWCELPKDFSTGVYNWCTEVYFIGKLFEQIIQELNIGNFKYEKILGQMIKKDSSSRIKSFGQINSSFLEEKYGEEFSEEEKDIYKRFSRALVEIIAEFYEDCKYTRDTEYILNSLTNIYKGSMLEDYVQDNLILASTFVQGRFSYYKHDIVSISILKDFINFFKNSNIEKRNIMLNNLQNKLNKIEKKKERITIDDVPF